MMDISGRVASQTQRDRGGRFAPGVSGNPAGKRPGTRNRATILTEALGADETGAVARLVIDRALAGDMVAARFCLGLLAPKPRSRPIELDLPDCAGLDGIVAAFDVTLAAMAAGDITPDEALTISKVLDRRRAAIEAKSRSAKDGTTRHPRDVTPDPVVIPDPSAVIPANARMTAEYCPDKDGSLHSACKPGVSDAPAKAAAATSGPSPAFGSACIRPASRYRTARFTASLLSSAAYPQVHPLYDAPVASSLRGQTPALCLNSAALAR
jgi:hypothetical protein